MAKSSPSPSEVVAPPAGELPSGPDDVTVANPSKLEQGEVGGARGEGPREKCSRRRVFACAAFVGCLLLIGAVAVWATVELTGELGAQTDRYALVEQVDAEIPVGGEVGLYFVGGSNVAVQTWPDQLHAYLIKLGYMVPDGGDAHTNMDSASEKSAPKCDDEEDFQDLVTPRIAKAGWGSWGFAYDSMDDCEDAPYVGETGLHPFRTIANQTVSCRTGWACKPTSWSRNIVRPSDVASDSRHAQVVLVSTWNNDFKQNFARYKCYNGTELSDMQVAAISIQTVTKLIRAVHAVNPLAVVMVMALYPDASGAYVNDERRSRIDSINQAVADGLREEPRAIFVDYSIPAGMEMFQLSDPGHLNCRGDRIMATSVLDALFRHKILSRSLALPPAEEARECLMQADCNSVNSTACCQAAAACYVDANGECAAYSVGGNA